MPGLETGTTAVTSVGPRKGEARETRRVSTSGSFSSRSLPNSAWGFCSISGKEMPEGLGAAMIQNAWLLAL